MKRHESLVPLSRDHHFGLIMAQRLTLGRATNPRADWPTGRAQQAQRLIEFFKSDLRAHFDIEETHVFPAAGRSMADDDRQVEALIADHDAMRAMIRGLEAYPASGPRRAPAGVRPPAQGAHPPGRATTLRADAGGVRPGEIGGPRCPGYGGPRSRGRPRVQGVSLGVIFAK